MPELTEEEAEKFVDIVLTIDERDAIELAKTSNSPWKHEDFHNLTKTALKSVKDKIKAYHLKRAANKCCYCRRSLRDEKIGVDREHIVPKGKFKSLTYEIFNLSVACKRCNMDYKKERVDHIVDHETIEADFRNPVRYLIPHPNIDLYESHILRISIQLGDGEVTAYKLISEKGKFLYDFVRLDRLCVNEIDIAQGGEKINEFIAESFQVPIEGA